MTMNMVDFERLGEGPAPSRRALGEGQQKWSEWTAEVIYSGAC